MNYLIINSHPLKDSLNNLIYNTIIEHASMSSHKVFTIDLIADDFNPVMSDTDLENWWNGKSNDKLVIDYQERINNADILVFTFPIWWGYLPAILKGFCDKVFMPFFAYTYGASGEVIGKFTCKKAIIITTMETTKKDFVEFYKDPIYGGFLQATLANIGFEIKNYLQIDNVKDASSEYINDKLIEIRNII